MLPTLLLVVATAIGLITNPIALVGLLLLCLAATLTLYALWVPLMPDELTTPGMVEAGRARIAAGKEAKAG
jgi:hypothetical protein